MTAGAMRRLPVLLAVLASGCTSDWSADLSEYESVGAGDSATDAIATEVQQLYGVRARRYTGLLNDSNEAERRFLDALPEVTAFTNQVCERQRVSFRFSEAELAINFISEGGFYLLDDDIVEDIDGYTYLGIDTLVDNLEALRPWLHGSILAAVAAGDRTARYENERGQVVHTLRGLSLEEGLYANAGMYAWSRALSERDIATTAGAAGPLGSVGSFFWGTLYYNSGVGAGHRKMIAQGVDYYRQRWTRADDGRLYGRNSQFNALWRTASFDYLLRTSCPAGSCTAPDGATPRTYASNDTPLAIPDADPRGVRSRLTVPDPGTVAGLRVSVDIAHTYAGDLVVELAHAGRVATLYDQDRIADPAGRSHDDLQATFTPADFAGVALAGPWELVVTDRVALDDGTLRRWSITTTPQTAAR